MCGDDAQALSVPAENIEYVPGDEDFSLEPTRATDD